MIKNISNYLVDKLAKRLPEDKKKMLSNPGLIYQKYTSKTDRFLSFIFKIEFYHLVWEYPNSDRYRD